MKKVAIFEPAMCCPTGLCGPSVNQDLLRVSTVSNNLLSKGISVERYNLTTDPQAFLDNKTINEIIEKDGVDTLPVTIVDGKVVKTKEYPTDEELTDFLDIPADYLEGGSEKQSECCAGGNVCDIKCSPAAGNDQKNSGCGGGCC